MRRACGNGADGHGEVDGHVSRRGRDPDEPCYGAAAESDHRPAFFVAQHVERAERHRTARRGEVGVHARVDCAQARVERGTAVETCKSISYPAR